MTFPDQRIVERMQGYISLSKQVVRLLAGEAFSRATRQGRAAEAKNPHNVADVIVLPWTDPA